MKDLELESRLQDYYATFTPADSGRAVAGVDRVVAKARARSGSRAGAGIGSRLAAWAGMKQARAGALVALAAVVVVVASAPLWLRQGTSPAESESASPSASSLPSNSASATASLPTNSVEPSPLALVKAAHGYGGDMNSDAAYVAGWAGSRLCVVHLYDTGAEIPDYHQQLISVDPAIGVWRVDGQWDGNNLIGTRGSDNKTVALQIPTGIDVVDESGTTRFVANPAGTPDDFGAFGMPALPGGGYLVTGADNLYRLASDGSGITSDPLPAGYVATGATSDPNLFILTTAADAQQHGFVDVGAPYRAYLWNLSTGSLKLVASKVNDVYPSPNSLAYLDTTGGWLSLAANGSTHSVQRPAAPGDLNSPDGSRYIWLAHSDVTSRVYPQTIELRETGTNRVLSTLSGVIQWVVWNGSVAAFWSTSDLVVLDGATVTRVPLP
jgi:hypothetical protein